jgi:hypothetical protein
MATSGVLERGEIVEANKTTSTKKFRIKQRFFSFIGENWLWLLPVTILGSLLFFAFLIPNLIKDDKPKKTHDEKKLTNNEYNNNLSDTSDKSSNRIRSGRGSSSGQLAGRYDTEDKRTP